MSEQFNNSYALVIGVDQNSVPGWALPDVAKDITAVVDVLTHPQRCAYVLENVKVLKGKGATRDGILGGLKWLRERIQSDPSGNTTAVVYYSGHGWRNTETQPPTYYLIPYDADQDTFPLSALRAEDFGTLIAALKPQRLLVVMDACRSGGMGIKDVGVNTPRYASAAIPPSLFLGEKEVTAPAGTKGLEVLSQGSGRAVLSSSRGGQRSWIRNDGRMSIFTYHFIEALTGHAQPAEGAKEVLVTDIMSYVSRQVPISAKGQHNADQQPEFQMSGGSWPVALLMGGKGLSKGELAPDPLQPLPALAAAPSGVQTMTGSGMQITGGTIHGDIAGRDIHKETTTHFYGPVTGPVHAGSGDINIDSLSYGQAGSLGQLFQALQQQIAAQAPADKRDKAQEKAQELREAITSPQPDLDTMGAVKNWFIKNIPQLAGAVTGIIVHPIVGKLVEAAGEVAASEFKRRFGAAN